MSGGPMHPAAGLNITSMYDKVVHMPVSEKTLAAHMSEEAAKVKESLKYLGKGNFGKPALPKHGLAGYAGFAIIHTVKASLLAGYERGSGIAVKVLGKDAAGHALLSAPVFLKTSKLSIGASVGYNKIYSVILVDREPDLALFTSTETTVGTDMAMHNVALGDEDGVSAHESKMKVESEEGTTSEPKVISVEDSACMMIDFSFAGGVIGPDVELNAKIYKDVPVADVLAGGVPVPEQFASLYEVLKKSFVDEAGVLDKPEPVVASSDAEMTSDQAVA